MRHRGITLLLVGRLALVASSAPAARPPGCPAGHGRGRELASIGGRAFAAEAGLVRETSVTPYCLGCHDGTVGRSVATGPAAVAATRTLLESTVPAGPAPGASHPVDVAYPAGRAGFRPISEVELAIPLACGRVTCASCHSGDDGSPARLTVTVELSRLCTTCHVK